MKSALLLLTFSPLWLYADHCAHVIPGLAATHTPVGAPPVCSLQAGRASIQLGGDTRFEWNDLSVGGTSPVQEMQIQSAGATSVHHSANPVVINGAVLSDGRTAIIGRTVTIGATGQITAPQLIVSSLAASPAQLEGLFGNGEVSLSGPANVAQNNVNNSGHLTSSNLTVAGYQVANRGVIEGHQGRVTLIGAPGAVVSWNAARPTGSVGNDFAARIRNDAPGRIAAFTVEMKSVPSNFSLPMRTTGQIVANRLDLDRLGDSGPILENTLPGLVAANNLSELEPLVSGSGSLIPNDGDSPTLAPASTAVLGGAVPPPSLPPLMTAYSTVNASSQNTAAKNQPAGINPTYAARGVSQTAATQRGDTNTKKKPAPAKKSKPAKVVRGTFFGLKVGANR